MSEENQNVESQTTEGVRRQVEEEKKGGLTLKDLLLTAILLAAGAVLKFLVGSFVNFFGMKPNFIIAMYCMAIALIRPKIWYCAVIGLIAGAICQFFPGTPWLNFASELAGALVMGALMNIPLKVKEFNFMSMIATFLSTIVSGGLFVVLLLTVIHADKSSLVAYVPIVLGTAGLNTVIVGALYLPLKKVLKK